MVEMSCLVQFLYMASSGVIAAGMAASDEEH